MKAKEIAMPQLSLYIDEPTLKKIESLAKIEKKSISKWVRSKLNNVIEKTWPEDYFSLFGSVSEDQLQRPDDLNLQHGSLIEPL
jgi:hypothetical protein